MRFFPTKKTISLKIGGMHCANCALTIERRLKEVTGARLTRLAGEAALHFKRRLKGWSQCRPLGRKKLVAFQEKVES